MTHNPFYQNETAEYDMIEFEAVSIVLNLKLPLAKFLTTSKSIRK